MYNAVTMQPIRHLKCDMQCITHQQLPLYAHLINPWLGFHTISTQDQGKHAYSVGTAFTKYSIKAPRFNPVILVLFLCLLLRSF